MGVWKIISKSILTPIDINKIEDSNDRFSAAIFTVIICALLGAVLMPVLYYIFSKDKFQISLDIMAMIKLFFIGLLSFLASCMIFVITAKLFKEKVNFKVVASYWGVSYIPNIVCIILYWTIQTFTFIVNSSIAGFILNTIFIMLLLWKVLYYFIEMIFVLRLKGKKLYIATIVTGITLLALILINFTVGLQVPMV